MENASKALLMAGGVLIGIMILSLAVYLIMNFGSASAEAHRINEQNQLNEFNVQFTAYEGRNDITIHDIVTVANLARSNNDKYGFTAADRNIDGNYYIEVNATGMVAGSKNNLESFSSDQLEELITEDLNSLVIYEDEDGSDKPGLKTYTCTVTINPTTQRVSAVNFKNNN